MPSISHLDLISINLTLYKQKRMKTFWNKIRKSRNVSDVNYNHVQLDVLEKHFSDKFSYDMNNEN